MSVRQSAMRQYQAIVSEVARRWNEGTAQSVPPGGWITTARKALGMSGVQLARRLGLTRARISQAEQAEREGGVTLKTMQAMAQAMNCRFVYAIVPDEPIDKVIEAQARKKAWAVVAKASTHMALEDQGLSESQNGEEIERLTAEYLRRMPSDFWSGP